MGDVIDINEHRGPTEGQEEVVVTLWIDPAREEFDVMIDETSICYRSIAYRLRDVADWLLTDPNVGGE